MNHEAYSDYKNEFISEFAYLRSQSHDRSIPVLSTTHNLKNSNGNSLSITSKGKGEDLLSLLAANGYRVSSTKELARLNDGDDYDAEVTAIAQVLAYFEISSKRIIDIMPMIFETVFARGFGKKLRKSLTSELNLIGDHGVLSCQNFAKDDPGIDERRAYLRRQIGILSDGQAIISRYFK